MTMLLKIHIRENSSEYFAVITLPEISPFKSRVVCPQDVDLVFDQRIWVRREKGHGRLTYWQRSLGRK